MNENTKTQCEPKLTTPNNIYINSASLFNLFKTPFLNFKSKLVRLLHLMIMC